MNRKDEPADGVTTGNPRASRNGIIVYATHGQIDFLPRCFRPLEGRLLIADMSISCTDTRLIDNQQQVDDTIGTLGRKQRILIESAIFQIFEVKLIWQITPADGISNGDVVNRQNGEMQLKNRVTRAIDSRNRIKIDTGFIQQLTTEPIGGSA